MSSRGHALTVGGQRLPYEQVKGLRASGLGNMMIRESGEGRVGPHRTKIPDTENIPTEKKARNNYLQTKRRQKAARLKYDHHDVEQEIKERLEREEREQKENRSPDHTESDDAVIVTDEEVEEYLKKRRNELCTCKCVVLRWIRHQKVALRKAKEVEIGRLLGTSDPKAMYDLYSDPSFQHEFLAYIDLIEASHPQENTYIRL
jgi:hypothetical protein